MRTSVKNLSAHESNQALFTEHLYRTFFNLNTKSKSKSFIEKKIKLLN